MENKTEYMTHATASQKKYSAVQEFRGIKFELLRSYTAEFIIETFRGQKLRRDLYTTKDNKLKKELLLKLQLHENRLTQKASEIFTEFNLNEFRKK